MTGGPAIVVLGGGVGGGRFLEGLRLLCRTRWPDGSGGTTAAVTAIVNTGDDAWLAGLRIAPDLDSITYRLAGVADLSRGWGRAHETERVSAELAAYGIGWPWFTLGDLDLGTHIARTALLREGLTLSQATARLLQRWDLGLRLLPMTDDEVETHVVVDDGSGGRQLHFQEWWARYRATLPARGFVQRGVESSAPAPGVLAAIEGADLVLLAPSNPVVSTGAILGVPGIREALRDAGAPVVGVSPIIGGAVVRGMADACLTAIGVETSAAAVAEHYGARSTGGMLDGWLVDTVDGEDVSARAPAGIRTSARPLLMTDPAEAAAIAADALALATP